MPKMTHWNHAEGIEVAPEKQAVYAAQGWVVDGAKAPKVQPAVTRQTAAVEEPAPVKQSAAKKAPAKKATAKKAAQKS